MTGTGYEPIPAVGGGADCFDLPSLFYLTNQALIDEWAELGTRARRSVDEWFRTEVWDSLVGPAADRGLRVSAALGPKGHRHVLLHRPEVPMLGQKPVIGAGLGWSTKRSNPSSKAAFACVRCSRNETGRRASAVFLARGGSAFRTASGVHGQGNDAWPIWWWIDAGDGWWTQLDAYRERIVSEVLRLVDGVSDALAEASNVAVVGSPDEPE